jgi:molecular chaperone DnaK (HSP70)
VLSVKHLLGKQWNDKDVQHMRLSAPFVLLQHSQNRTAILIQVTYKGKTRYYSPEEICSMILAKVRVTP